MNKAAWLGLFSVVSAVMAVPQQTTTPVIRVTARMVYIDVAVRDSRGNPVHGLSAKDFTVKEDGKSQTVEYFEDRSQPPAANTFISPAAATPGRANEFSNVVPSDQSDRPVNIVLMDLLDTPQLDQLYALKQLTLFCKSLPPGHQVALFLLTTQLYMLQPFNASSNDLIAAANRINAKDDTLIRSQGEKMQTDDIIANWSNAIGHSTQFVKALKAEIAAEDDRDLVERARIVQDAFTQIVRATAGYHGRKNLIWLAEDFPIGFAPALQIDQAAQYVDVRDTANLIASSQIAVYPISLSGTINNGVGASSSGSGEVNALGGKYGNTLRDQFQQRRTVYDSISDVARETGGKAFFGTNDFAGALQEVVAHDADAYTLAYRSTDAKWDGRYRKINVHSGVKNASLSYPRGYYATPEDQPDPRLSAQLNQSLKLHALNSTILRLRADVTPPVAGYKAVTVDSTIDASDLTYTIDNSGIRHAQVLVLLIAANPDLNATPSQTSGMLHLDLSPAQYADMLKNGIRFRQQMPLDSGRYQLRIGVAEAGTHRIGTLTMPVLVP